MPQRNRPLFFRSLVAFCSVLFVLVACSSEADIGEDCDQDGKTDGQCVDTAVCAKNKAGALKCLKICNDQTDCSKTDECNGVSGSSIKACRPR